MFTPVHSVQLRQGLFIWYGMKEVHQLGLELRSKLRREELMEGGVALGVMDVGQGKKGEEGGICCHGPSSGVQEVLEGCHGM